ncbi:G-type lectin S-receptor-like serine/threonine-protein kinase LECRK2 [Rosa rugosa]|uniref:G-type lectin S-receptor-like serine/threonine-protein kinase LECRK2 n=1 Tax=Rosa rugosa TaxID=74645 RepID=UPI002B410468|nr:G-type lectin S-receptor-like serine/threonine-protein kinase LECRK2 [Rosa rugosa]
MAFALSYSICFLLILLQLLSFSTMAQTYKNISLGSSLIAQENNSFWASPSGEFAFGFQNIGNDGFLLAIWFNRIPERTIVWSANGNSLVQRGSTVELTSDGQLLLIDIATGKDISVASSAGTRVTHAAMLDSGNFVLANQNSISSWESFNRPTDTILPTQTLSKGSILYAPYTKTNYSKGRFMLTLQSDGNFVFYTTFFPLDSPNVDYWYTETEGSGFEVIFNQSGSIYVTAQNGSILYVLSSNAVSTQDYYQRATLDYDGVLRHYIYPKSNSSIEKAWSTLVFTPPNICTSVLEITGGGACGFNSLCRNDDLEGPSCQCPDGYNFTDPNDLLKGCKQGFVSQSCEEASQETDLFYLQEMRSTDWATSANYEYFQPVTEDWCRRSCLGDCFCDIAFYKDQICWKKSIPLSNGRIDRSSDWKALVKIRNQNSSSRITGAETGKKDNSALILQGLVFLISSSLFVFLCLIATCLLVYRIYHRIAKVSKLYPTIEGVNLRCFTYMELKEATDGFKNELGRGAFATVFKGVLVSDNGKYVAVKRLMDTMLRENDPEFKAEVSTIGRTNHRNLVQLLGFCNEGQHRILVYELMSNGTLASFLFGESKLNWHRRKQIALGIARGLLYLHEDCSSQIIHCDIKPENVLLDDTFTARIADFGLAKLLRTDQTRTITAIRGTKGYVAPEWFKALPITVKVDVYSYGILLLEIICCRKNFEAEATDENEMILANWAYDCYNQRKLHLLLDSDDEAMDDIRKMEKCVMTALWCIQQDPSLRPTMKDVTQMLEGTVEISIPPNPSFS